MDGINQDEHHRFLFVTQWMSIAAYYEGDGDGSDAQRFGRITHCE
ncbi:hypothetical protein [Brevibacillus laterosporus]|nr:hypothetical protein [Brevibacillus laterosporus]